MCLGTLVLIGLKLDWVSELEWEFVLQPLVFSLYLLGLFSLSLFVMLVASVFAYLTGTVGLQRIFCLLLLTVTCGGISLTTLYLLEAILAEASIYEATVPPLIYLNVYLVLLYLKFDQIVRILDRLLHGPVVIQESTVRVMVPRKVTQTLHFVKVTSSFFKAATENEQGEGETVCEVCYGAPSQCVFLPCHHGGVCYACALLSCQQAGRCHLCRHPVNLIYELVAQENGVYRAETSTVLEHSTATIVNELV